LPGLRAGPLAQAGAQSSVIERGTFLEFSTSSAMTRKANAYAFLLASSSVAPYTITPGTAAISAIQRPSSSRSVSMFQCTSSLLTPADGFLLDTLIRCRFPEAVAHYDRNAERTYNNTAFLIMNLQVCWLGSVLDCLFFAIVCPSIDVRAEWFCAITQSSYR